MPRKAPTSIQENRITFGTYERQFVTSIKEDIETAVKVAVIAPPVAIATAGIVAGVGVGYMGYFIMKGLQGFSLGIDDALDPVTTWYDKWFKFTNSETGKKESVMTNWYDYVFNNQEAEQMRADNPLPSHTAGNDGYNDEGDVVDWDAAASVIENAADAVQENNPAQPDEMLTHENTGGNGTAEADESSNWPFTSSWWPF
jgi:hypothetical protein